MAGIDDIGGQVYPQGEDDNYDLGVFQVRNGEFYHFMLGKLASSLAALDEKKHGNAMCEIFGNYGWQEGLVWKNIWQITLWCEVSTTMFRMPLVQHRSRIQTAHHISMHMDTIRSIRHLDN